MELGGIGSGIAAAWEAILTHPFALDSAARYQGSWNRYPTPVSVIM